MTASFATQRLILVTGAARSGKSEWAERLAQRSTEQRGSTVTYLATAHNDLNDAEWQVRIVQHQQRRPAAWQTLLVPVALPAAIDRATATDCLLVDSLGTWLANLLDQDEAAWEQTAQVLCNSLQESAAQVILVAEETGWGVVPAYPLGRRFRDRLGTLIRRVGAIADIVYLVTGGYALNVTELGTSIDRA